MAPRFPIGRLPTPIFDLPLVFDILRSEDLLSLQVEAYNLSLSTEHPDQPELVVMDAGQPAYLVIGFQAQTIFEQAFFQAGPTLPTNPPPGQVEAQMGGGSRLVFELPVDVKSIPFEIQGLLDWSELQPVLSATAQGLVVPPPITEPTDLETAIELPYRLVLSPTSTEVGWSHSLQAVTFGGRTELWHTRIANKHGSKGSLVEAANSHTVPLRAIWSPDFVDHQPLLPPSDVGVFLGPMTAADREKIVILTSGASGYFVELPNSTAVPFIPTPIEASRLFLSTLGGWLTSHGSWPSEPSFKATDGSTQTVDLTDWRHVATQGRDHYVRIVYAGWLYPFGHKAALVKVTERKFYPPDLATGDTPIAYSIQHEYIVVLEQEKTYPTSSFTYAGREMPFFQSVRINTPVTPDIEAPQYIPDGSNNPSSFWVEVNSSDFEFHCTGVDLAGNQIDLLAAMIFVDENEQSIHAIAGNYATSGVRRLCTVHGRKIAYADPAAGDTILRTSGLNFATEVSQDSPPFPDVPFIPVLASADVLVPAIEEIMGTSAPVTIELYGPYLSSGLDSNAGVYAQIDAPQPQVEFSAEQAGGFATPNLVLTALSARKGLVGGDPADAAAGLIDPSGFFGSVAEQGMLFGTIPLEDLIPTSPTTQKADAARNAPEIRTHLQPNSASPTSEVTEVLWSPDLQNYSAGALSIVFDQGGTSALNLSASLTRYLNGDAPSTQVKGELTFFQVQLSCVVFVTVESLKFNSEQGQKTMVDATLASSNPIAFQGPLAFVQDLANVLPPSVFGGTGPSIDLTSTEVQVAYTIGLPTLSIGVFSLQDISFMAGLDLPYFNGQPEFEFAFASRSSPFLLTVECIGGGGFIHLVLDTDGVQMVEGSLEFGGNFSIDLGVASGGVHVMAGIYFQLKSDYTDLTGFVDIGGEVSVLGIISVSINLNLSLSYQTSNGESKVQGRATLSISVTIVFFSMSVSVSVERSYGNGPGDPLMNEVLSVTDWSTYAEAFA